MLTQEQIQNLFEYLESGELRWKYQANKSKIWNSKFAGKLAGSITIKNRCRIGLNGKRYWRSHLIWIFHKGSIPENKIIDHRDTNSLNDRIDNLRPATHSENRVNAKLASNNKSGYKGVSFEQKTNKWVARLKVGKRNTLIGRFVDKEDAALAYAKAQHFAYGEFARQK